MLECEKLVRKSYRDNGLVYKSSSEDESGGGGPLSSEVIEIDDEDDDDDVIAVGCCESGRRYLFEALSRADSESSLVFDRGGNLLAPHDSVPIQRSTVRF